VEKSKSIYRYSQAFKQKLVSEIESGKLTISQAQKIYDIGGGQTIQKWLMRFGKAHLLNKVIHIEMRDEKDKIKELERQKQALESALAQAQLKIITLESTIKVLESESGVKLKKSTDTKSLNVSSETADLEKDDIK
jgi:transposase-like protein